MSRFEELIPDLLLQAKGCPRSVLIREIRRCAVDLFERTGLWREPHDAIYTIAGVTEYELDPPRDGRVAALVSVVGERGEELEWSQRTPEILDLEAIPERRERLTIEMAVKPARRARGIPDSQMDMVEKGLLAGTAARLLLMSGQSWSNPSLGMEEERRYQNEIRRLRVRAVRQHSNRPLTVRIRGFI